MKKTGLVLEGGGHRGLFTAGVLDVFLEQGISADGMIGVSAGAVFGCNYKSRQAGRVLRYNIRFCRNWRYCSLRSWFLTGNLFGTDFCYHEIPDHLDPFDQEAFRKNPMEFYLVCTDVKTGLPVYRKCEDLQNENLLWLQATASMPVVSRKVAIGDGFYLDGAIRDSIPLSFMQQHGYERNIVIRTQPEGFEKEPQALMWLVRSVYRKYPEFSEAVARRHLIYNSQLEYVHQQVAEGNTFLLCPETMLPIAHVTNSRRRMQETYEAGRKVAEKNLDALRQWLETGAGIKVGK